MSVVKKNIALLCVVLLLLTTTACNKKEDVAKDAAAQKLIVEEHNAAGDKFYTEMSLAKEASAKYSEKLLNLYLYEIAEDDIYELFQHDAVTEDGDIVSDFWTTVREELTTDTYGDYLRSYASAKSIVKTELLPTLNTWHAMSESAQYAVIGTVEDYSDFAFVDCTEVLHKFYTRTGRDDVTEIYKFIGSKADNLAIIITWQQGKIVDVVRLFNAT